MIESIKLVNFRNFSDKNLSFSKNKNFIIGENGKGKTNILESISLLCNSSVLGLNFDTITNKNSDFFYIEAKTNNGDKLAISYDKKENKKKYIINDKNTSKKKLGENSFKTVIFSPIIMNVMYLSPSLRRSFLDDFLLSAYPKYEKILREYKNIVKNRNKVLKNVNIGKSNKDELDFWDNKFVLYADLVYKYRFKITDFIKKHIEKFGIYFGDKVKEVKFEYKTKVKENNSLEYLEKYIKKNRDRDIILKKTIIGPHVDDFDILLDDMSLVSFASRGETKSVIIGLKELEIKFIEEKTKSKPILLIDDLLSELDENHKNILLKNIKNYQVFITSINDIKGDNIIKL